MVTDAIDVEENYVISVFGHLLESVYVDEQMPSFVPELIRKTYVSRSDNVMAPAFIALEIAIYTRIFRADIHLRHNAVAFDAAYEFNALLQFFVCAHSLSFFRILRKCFSETFPDFISSRISDSLFTSSADAWDIVRLQSSTISLTILFFSFLTDSGVA